MNKNQAIALLNAKLNGNHFTRTNTHWSNLVIYGKDLGWWLNIPFNKFEDELFIILNDSVNKSLLLIQIPANKISYPEQKFRNKENTADIFISLNDKARLTDIQATSTSFEFGNYLLGEFSWE